MRSESRPCRFAHWAQGGGRICQRGLLSDQNKALDLRNRKKSISRRIWLPKIPVPGLHNLIQRVPPVETLWDCLEGDSNAAGDVVGQVVSTRKFAVVIEVGGHAV